MSKKKNQSYNMPDEVIWVSDEEREQALLAAEAEALEEMEDESAPAPEEQAIPAVTMPYAIWFAKALKRKKVKFHQEESLLVFFKKQGLSKNEPEDAYFAMLTKY